MEPFCRNNFSWKKEKTREKAPQGYSIPLPTKTHLTGKLL